MVPRNSLFFASRGSLVECVCLFFCFLSLFLHLSRSMRASLKSAKIARSLVCPFLISCFLLLLPCAWLEIIFLSLPSIGCMCDFFRFLGFHFSTSSCYFHPVYFFWLVLYVVFSVSVVTCTAYSSTACIWYVRARASFFHGLSEA